MQPRITPSNRKGEKKQGSLNVNRLSNVTDPGRLKKGSIKKKLRKGRIRAEGIAPNLGGAATQFRDTPTGGREGKKIDKTWA
jgi:hypothetical protein